MISVLITAYNRKEFIISAINSVMSQSIIHPIEVIVIKNFLDEEIDEFISSNGIKSIFVGECSVGQMLRIAIENANGDIISFLDDDDLFSRLKLEIVENIFYENPDLMFFHNSQQRFFNNELSNVNVIFPEIKKSTLTEIRVNENSVKDLAKLVLINQWGEFYFNLSSISIRKTCYISFLNDLEKITGHTDDFFFFHALNDHYNRKIIISTEKLTLYRMHESTSQSFEPNLNIQKKIAMSKIHLDSMRIIRNGMEYNLLIQVLNYKVFSEAFELSIYTNDFDDLRREYYKLRSILQMIYPLYRILPLKSLIIVFRKYIRFLIEIKRDRIKGV